MAFGCISLYHLMQSCYSVGNQYLWLHEVLASLIVITVIILAEGLENIGLLHSFTLFLCNWCFGIVFDGRGFSFLSLMRICIGSLRFHYKFGHPALIPFFFGTL
uniref:Uncharacterized protein n=1 Tax=Arundo donax TaxID=35708 RepID=A0A0A9DTA7_ARUDO